jgi:hypothetical protein
MMLGYKYTPATSYEGGWSAISLREMISKPDVAVAQVMSNVQNNALEFAIQATIFEFGQRFTRKMLSKPINKVNALVFTGKQAPLRGMGVRI